MELRLSPEVFWALSVTEWRWLAAASLGGLGGAPQAMDRDALHALMQQHPDRKSCKTTFK
ncbi:MAG: phage tail assembly chaperone [Marinicaulis sp.]|nr:phage tail assembly chaperone [Marinicaulis sp.]